MRVRSALSITTLAACGLFVTRCQRARSSVEAVEPHPAVTTEASAPSQTAAAPRPDTSCTAPEERFVFRFLQQMLGPESTAIPAAITMAEGGPTEVRPPDATPADGGQYSWTSARFPARAIPAGQHVYPSWPIIPMPPERSVEGVRQRIQSKRAEVFACYQQHGAPLVSAALDAGLLQRRWRLSAQFVIGPAGVVSDVRVQRTAGDAAPLTECVSQALRSLAFERACMTAEVQFTIDALPQRSE